MRKGVNDKMCNTLPVGSVSNSFTITKSVLELTVEPILARFFTSFNKIF
jgi:hypothetical protein